MSKFEIVSSVKVFWCHIQSYICFMSKNKMVKRYVSVMIKFKIVFVQSYEVVLSKVKFKVSKVMLLST